MAFFASSWLHLAPLFVRVISRGSEQSVITIFGSSVKLMVIIFKLYCQRCQLVVLQIVFMNIHSSFVSILTYLLLVSWVVSGRKIWTLVLERKKSSHFVKSIESFIFVLSDRAVLRVWKVSKKPTYILRRESFHDF